MNFFDDIDDDDDDDDEEEEDDDDDYQGNNRRREQRNKEMIKWDNDGMNELQIETATERGNSIAREPQND